MTNSERRDIVRGVMRTQGFDKLDGPWSHGNRVTARFEIRKSLQVFKILKNLFPEFRLTRRKVVTWGRVRENIRRVTIYIPKEG